MGREYMRMGAAAALALLLTLSAMVFGTRSAQALPQYSYDCKFCHQMPPKDSGTAKKNPFTGGVPGNHKGHASDQASSCVPCHGGDVTSYNNEHRNKVIELNEAINYSLKRPGVFLNQTTMPPNPLGTCAVACHSDGKGGGTPFSPVWGSDPTQTDCSTCHGAAPNSGSHFVKHAAYFGNSPSACAKCHSDHASEGKPFEHATSAASAVKRGIDVRFTATPNNGGRFESGSCSNIYCHSDGRNNYKQVSWTTGTTLGCDGCHGVATTAGADALSGKHGKHVDNASFLGTNYTCADCHAGVVTGNSSIVETSLHVNGNVTLSGGVNLGTVNSGTCSSSYCHSDGKGTFKNVTWTQTETLGCNGCHGTGPGNTTGAPDYATEGGGAVKANSHDKHVTSANDCVNCHSKTMNGTALLAGGQHIDGFNNFTSGNGKTFGKLDNKTCSNISCHSGNDVVHNVAPAQWGAHLDCSGCHSTLTPGHAAHAGLYGCVDCHAGVVSSNTVISTPAKHMNNTADVAGATLTSFTPPTSNSLADASCTTSCHMSAAPKWNVPSTGQCGSCHDAFSPYGPTINTLAHGAHFTAVNGPQLSQDATGCQVCHVYNGERVAPHATGGRADMQAGYAANGACAQCHRSTSTKWDPAITTVTCDSCHNSTVAPLSFISNMTAPDIKYAVSNGHGRSGIGKTCADCHDKNSAHINGVPGDKRLVAALGDGTDNNECNYCHSDAGKVQANVGIKTHQAFGSGSLCADCHNVHGTNGNTMMVRENIAGTTVSFTGNSTFANDGRTGVCQVCHTYTRFFTKAGEPQANHVESTSNCLDCHSHNPATGFAFSANGACDACHGYPPAPRRTIQAASFGIQGNWSSAKFEDYSGGGGAHTIAAHVPKDLRLTGTDTDWTPCLPCHYDAANSHRRSVPVKSHIENVSVQLDPQYRFSNDYYFVYSSAKFVSGGQNQTGTCFNVSCHMGPTPKWSIER